MPDYERSEDVPAGADELFAYLSDVQNLPKYFSHMTAAEPAQGEAVRVKAEIDEGEGEHEVEGKAWFRVHRDERRLEWGSEGPNDYRGELEVTGDAGGARVAVRLHTERDDRQAIEEGLAETVENVRRLVGGAAA
jgi:hypothetical protein